MKASIIFHSYSGITRGIARKIQAACGGDLIEVAPRTKYSTLTAYTLGCMRARSEECDPVDPDTIDVSSSDLIVIGTPVWAWKATPVINGAVTSLAGCTGKKAVIFATCGGQAGETLPILKKKLEAKGVTVIGDFVFAKNEVEDPEKVNGLITAVQAAMQSA
ncbi:MAG: flavodoxin [Methanoregulaceae archaeon]